MSFRNYVWDIPTPNWEVQHLLVGELGISPITAQILCNRGIDSVEGAKIFLYGTLEDISSPWQFSGMESAVNRILAAVNEKERILIYGDYDVDGMTATALLVLFLKSIGEEPGYYIPNRDEGYGLNKLALDLIKEQGYSLIITVDCGISASEEVNYGKSLSLDFIITDHHEPDDTTPEFIPIINPKLDKDEKHYSELAGVGVAFKLVQGLAEKMGLPSEEIEKYLDLVALGTIADIVPLTKENRILVKYGMEKLRSCQRPGIKALLEVAGIEGKDLGTYQLAFMLAPRLNAAGRMGQPLVSLELLLTNSIQLAHEKSVLLQQFNSSRQLVEQTIQKEVLDQLKKGEEELTEKVLVLASPLWHSGVLGIVASRLAESLSRPVILFTIEGEQAKGSGRSVAGFDLFKSVKYCEKLLLKFGGHAQAVGITLEEDKLPAFKEMINHYAETAMESELMKPKLDLETLVLTDQLDFQLIKELALLEPFGCGNPRPIFGTQKIFFKNCRSVGKNNNHLKCTVSWENSELDGIGFNMGEPTDYELALKEPLDLAFSLEENNWNGQTKIQLVFEDFKKHHHCHSEKLVPMNFLQPLKIKEPLPGFNENYYYSHGNEQLHVVLDLITSQAIKNKRVLLTFPSQRILALYEGFLCENLIKGGINCERLTNQKFFSLGPDNLPYNSTYLIQENSLLSQNKDFAYIKYLFPKWGKNLKPTENRNCQIIGFKPLSFKNYQFKHSSVPRSRKTEFLKELSSSCEKPLIIYVNRKSLVIDLYYVLKKTFPGDTKRIWCYYSDLTFEQKEMVVQATLGGLADIIITSELFELRLGNWVGAKTKILAEAPYNPEELFLKSRPQRDKVQVFGIWTEEDLTFNEKILEAIYPSQEELFMVFHYLASIHTIKTQSKQQVINLLQRSYPNLQRATLQYVLDIVLELQNQTDQKDFADFSKTKVFELAELEKQSLMDLKNILAEEEQILTDYFLAGNS